MMGKMKNKIKLGIFSATAAVLIFGSCSTTPISYTSSITPMEGKRVVENLGKTEGKDSAYSILGIYMIGRPDLDLALRSAIEKKGGDTLINVSCYETYSWFILFSRTTVSVEGDAVKFIPDNAAGKGQKK
ncbi:MAG: hypothetical protein FWH53_05840 [Leptospirales bacterium]|nr:hypothetical protein [Leptospirales bacterium]